MSNLLTMTMTILLPFILKSPAVPVVATGPGLAACPAAWPVDGMAWSFTWSASAHGNWWCVPMLRSNRQDNVAETMHSCGVLCNAVLVLNEPESQEACWVDCQVEFLHRVYPQIMAENPTAQVVFWNGAYPSPGWVELFAAEWFLQFPGEPLPAVDIGVHLYLWPRKETRALLAGLDQFERTVGDVWPGANVLVTEGGSLYSPEEHVRWLAEVAPALETYAVFGAWE